MNYYRVKAEYDQKERIKQSRFKARRVADGIFVANELYTSTELKRFYMTQEQAERIFEEVVIPKNKVYWCFGCRFEATT